MKKDTTQIYNLPEVETKYVKLHISEYRDLIQIKGRYTELKEMFEDLRKKPNNPSVKEKLNG